MKHIIFMTFILWGVWCSAQPSVKAEVSKDTVGIGETVQITYTIENGQGRFEPPDMSEVPVISGPNSSSSMIYQNGKMSSSQSYSYVLRPTEEGKIKVPGALYKDKSETIHIEPMEIIVTKYIRPSSPKTSEPKPAPSQPAREKKKF